jgi:hypothetical protein
MYILLLQSNMDAKIFVGSVFHILKKGYTLCFGEELTSKDNAFINTFYQMRNDTVYFQTEETYFYQPIEHISHGWNAHTFQNDDWLYELYNKGTLICIMMYIPKFNGSFLVWVNCEEAFDFKKLYENIRSVIEITGFQRPIGLDKELIGKLNIHEPNTIMTLQTMSALSIKNDHGLDIAIDNMNIMDYKTRKCIFKPHVWWVSL